MNDNALSEHHQASRAQWADDADSAFLAYREATERWRERHPNATVREREQANSDLFCEMILRRRSIEKFCRTCGQTHEMTVIPMESDPSVFRIECRCCGHNGNP